MLPDANFLSSRCQSPSSRAQKLHFCAFLAFGTPVFRHFEHKIGVFVRFCPPEPSFSGVSSTKSRFLCAFAGGWSPTCGRRLRKEGIHTGHDARIAGTTPELRARCQRCSGVGRNKKAPAVPEPSMYVCCVRVIVVEYVSTRTCDVYTFLYTFPYARTFVLLHICTFALVRMYVCMCMLVEMEGLEPSSNKTIQKFSTCLAPI